MNTQIIIAVSVFCGMFILFLVLSNSVNNIINHLSKTEYLVTKELALKKEQKEIQKLFQEDEEEESSEE